MISNAKATVLKPSRVRESGRRVERREVTLSQLNAAVWGRQRLEAIRRVSAPCPHCGRLLSKVLAMQCCNCGMDWHGAEKS